VWFIAGSLGLGPADLKALTLRELLWLAEGHGRDRWGRLSVLLALTANLARDPKKSRPLSPAEFDPYADKHNRRANPAPADMTELRERFAPLRVHPETRP